MASASKTPNLNLPQWVGTEKPERTDFNAAFDAIDTTVASHLAEIVTDVGGAHGFETEFGTWTPVLNVAGGYSAQIGHYVRVGNLVTLTYILTITSKSGTGQLAISGLPFLPAVDAVYAYPLSKQVGFTFTGTELIRSLVRSIGAIQPYWSTFTNDGPVTDAHITSNLGIIGNVTYRI